MDLSHFDISTISTGSLALMIVISFMRGWVVPRSTLRDRTASYDSELKRTAEDRDDWRDVALSKDVTILEQSRQISELLVGTRTTHAIVQALPSDRDRSAPGHG